MCDSNDDGCKDDERDEDANAYICVSRRPKPFLCPAPLACGSSVQRPVGEFMFSPADRGCCAWGRLAKMRFV